MKIHYKNVLHDPEFAGNLKGDQGGFLTMTDVLYKGKEQVRLELLKRGHDDAFIESYALTAENIIAGPNAMPCDVVHSITTDAFFAALGGRTSACAALKWGQLDLQARLGKDGKLC